MKALALLLIVALMACAPNPHGFQEGQWVTSVFDNGKYMIAEVRLDMNNDDGTLGYVKLKNESGEVMDRLYPLTELDPWVDPRVSFKQESVLEVLRQARLAYESSPTVENRVELGTAIKMVEDSKPEIFRERKWNPTTKKYE